MVAPTAAAILASPLAGIYVKADGELLTHLYVELLELVLTEYLEDTLLGELIVGLKYKFLNLPSVARTSTHATAGLKSRDNLTLYFHNVDCDLLCKITILSSIIAKSLRFFLEIYQNRKFMRKFVCSKRVHTRVRMSLNKNLKIQL